MLTTTSQQLAWLAELAAAISNFAEIPADPVRLRLGPGSTGLGEQVSRRLAVVYDEATRGVSGLHRTELDRYTAEEVA